MNKKAVQSTNKDKDYNQLITSVGVLLEQARKDVYYHANQVLVKTYWEVGKMIVSYEKETGKGAGYGSKLFEEIARDLREKYGKGFSKSNVYLMKIFYLKYPKFQMVSGKLSWSHYVELLSILEDIERSIYMEHDFEKMVQAVV